MEFVEATSTLYIGQSGIYPPVGIILPLINDYFLLRRVHQGVAPW